MKLKLENEADLREFLFLLGLVAVCVGVWVVFGFGWSSIAGGAIILAVSLKK